MSPFHKRVVAIFRRVLYVSYMKNKPLIIRWPRWAGQLVVLMSLIFGHNGVAGLAPAENILVGGIYADAPTGVAFVVKGKASYLLRVGWLQNGAFHDGLHEFNQDMRHLHASSPGWRYNRIRWSTKRAHITLQWSRVGSAIVGKLRADHRVLVAVETMGAWQPPIPVYKLSDHLIVGKTAGQAMLWHLVAGGHPAATLCASSHAGLLAAMQAGHASHTEQSPYTALLFHLGKTPIYFSAGFGKLPALAAAPALIQIARRQYRDSRARAFGDWGNIIAPITDTLGANRLYNPGISGVTYVATRDWMTPSNVVVFEWDSFFSGVLGAIEDPYRAERNMDITLQSELPDGMLANLFVNGANATSHRSQPPIEAMCVWNFYQRHPDKAFLKAVYSRLVQSHQWWFDRNPATGLPYRDSNRDGLLEYANGPESGMDDSPMYDNARMAPRSNTMELDDVGLNSLWAADAGYLARISRVLGKTNAARRFERQRNQMIVRINKLLWNPRAGMYENRFFHSQLGDRPVPTSAYLGRHGHPGVDADYYRGLHFHHLLLARRDRAINFNWFSQPPLPSLSGNQPMSVRWRGYIVAPQTGRYQFVLNLTFPYVWANPGGFLPSFAGAELWINGHPIISRTTIGPVTRLISRPIRLTAGKKVTAKLEYRRAKGGAMVQLRWLRPGTHRRIFSHEISPTNFYPMILNAPSSPMAGEMLKVLTSRRRFWGRFVVPSIERSDPSFPQQYYWRGSIWAATNYLLFQGLLNYAHPRLLNRYAAKNVRLFMLNWNKSGTSNEHYSADGMGIGDPHYTWGTLLCLVGIDDICDILPDGKIRLNGTLNIHEKLKHLPIAGRSYDVDVMPYRTELIYRGNVLLEARDKVVTRAVNPTTGLSPGVLLHTVTANTG